MSPWTSNLRAGCLYVSQKKVSAVKGSAAPARRTQEQRRAATRGAIVTAGRELFAEHGFAGVSREEIVARAGLTRGAMHLYFATKELLFAAVYEEVERDLCLSVAGAAMPGKDAVDMLRMGAVAFLKASATDEVRRIILQDGPAVLPRDVAHRLAEEYGLGLIRATLQEVADAGRLGLGPVEMLAPVFMGGLHEAANIVADGGDAKKAIKLIEQLIARITTPAS